MEFDGMKNENKKGISNIEEVNDIEDLDAFLLDNHTTTEDYPQDLKIGSAPIIVEVRTDKTKDLLGKSYLPFPKFH